VGETGEVKKGGKKEREEREGRKEGREGGWEGGREGGKRGKGEKYGECMTIQFKSLNMFSSNTAQQVCIHYT
jgi:hypothetical protein